MTRAIENLLQNAAIAVTERRAADLLGLFSLPMPTFAEDQIKVLVCGNDLTDATERYFEQLDKLGVKSVRLGEHSTKRLDSTLYLVAASWLYLKSDDSLAFVSTNNLYLRYDGKGAPLIEVIEAVHSTNPAFHQAMGTELPRVQA